MNKKSDQYWPVFFAPQSIIATSSMSCIFCLLYYMLKSNVFGYPILIWEVLHHIIDNLLQWTNFFPVYLLWLKEIMFYRIIWLILYDLYFSAEFIQESISPFLEGGKLSTIFTLRKKFDEIVKAWGNGKVIAFPRLSKWRRLNIIWAV